MRQKTAFRIRLVFLAVFLFVLLIIWRLYSLQVIHHEELLLRAENQYLGANTKIFERGSIFLQGKNGTLVSGAALGSGWTVAMDPKRVENKVTVFEQISPLLPSLTRDDFLLKAAKTHDPYEVLAVRVPDATVHTLRKLNIDGLIYSPEQWRYYPGGSLASHVLGFVGFVDTTQKGVYGLERGFDQVLTRKTSALTTNFFSELFGDVETVVTDARAPQGDVITTIDAEAQSFLERTLSATKDKWSSKRVAGIIMDPKTGEIIAMAALPNFDPNKYKETENISYFSNPLVESVYEMGSIIKILDVAAGIDSGVITEQSTYYDSGSIVLDKKTIRNFDSKARGTVSVKEILRQSLNVGAAHVAKLLGHERMREYFLDKYKLGEETGIDLPGEIAGLTNNLESPRAVEYATAAFGQGIAITPVATIRALASVVNGGYLVQPHVVKKLVYPGGREKILNYDDEKERILKPETSEIVSRILVSVVDEKLAEGRHKMPHHTVGAKTGTAQIPVPGAGYSPDKFLHSFFGFVPAYNPRYVILLINIEPQGAKYASDTLTQPFVDIVHFLVNYYTIPPDR